MKTVSQLAQELNVNRTTLHRLIQRNNIETLQEGNKRLIDAQAEQAILKAFSSKSSQDETLQNNNKLLQQRNVAQAEQLANKDKIIDSLQSQLDLLQAETKALREQIADRDKTIDSLKADKIFLQQQIKEHTEQITNLTTALTAAQALHGMDKQQAVIEVKERPAAANAESRPQSERQQPHRKQSMLDSLLKAFRRKQA